MSRLRLPVFFSRLSLVSIMSLELRMSLKRLVANAEASAEKAARHADAASAAANTCMAAANMAVAERISSETALAHLRAQADRIMDWWDYSESDAESESDRIVDGKNKRKGFGDRKSRGKGKGSSSKGKNDFAEDGFAETVIDQLKSLPSHDRKILQSEILAMVGQVQMNHPLLAVSGLAGSPPAGK